MVFEGSLLRRADYPVYLSSVHQWQIDVCLSQVHDLNERSMSSYSSFHDFPFLPSLFLFLTFPPDTPAVIFPSNVFIKSG